MRMFVRAILLFVLLVSGCTTGLNGVPYSEAGEVLIQAAVADLPVDAAYAEITFTQGRHDLTHQISVTGHTLSGSITVPVGVWDIVMVLYDANGAAQFQDQVGAVMVQPGQQAAVKFNLRPADALVQVYIDLSLFPSAHEVYRARVYFGDRLEELTRETLEEPLGGVVSLPPGSYDFSVQLYTGSFRISDRIFTGTWHILDVNPAEELTVHWEPAMESLSITAHIHQLPQAPQLLQVTAHGAETHLEWLPSPDAVQGYRIYWQPSLWEPFMVVNDTVWLDTHFVHAEEPQGLYAVAAVSPIGIDGYRTEPTAPTFP